MKERILLSCVIALLTKYASASHKDEATVTCASPASNGALLAHEFCTKFYQCTWGTPIEFTCPSNLHFSTQRQYCEWPENANCVRNQVPEVDDNDSGICSVPVPNGALLPHQNCNKFYQCAWGTPVEFDCPANLHFNPERQYCDSQANSNCSRNSTLPDNGNNTQGICDGAASNGQLFPHANCSKFYQCSWGIPIELDCPSNLHFSADKHYCDWPVNANCISNVTVPENENSTNSSQPSVICAAAGSNGILLPHEDCSKFYQCSFGNAVALDCPANLFFNPELQYCDWPHNVKCERDVLDKEIDHNPIESPFTCATGANGILIPHEECNKYYQCSFDTPVVHECPSNLFFNPDAGFCDWPENVNCNREIPNPEPKPEDGIVDNNNNTSVGDDPSHVVAICTAEGSHGILIAHEDCSKFYQCAFGRPVVHDCPLNLLYNPDKEYCDWPENVNCVRDYIPNPNPNPEPPTSDIDNNNNNSGGNSDPSQAPAICAAEGSDGVLVAHEDCSKFYKCSEGVPVAIDCPLNLLYNPDKEYCDWPENVNCDRENIPAPETTPAPEDGNVDNNNSTSGGNSDPSQAPAICAAEGSDGILVAHEDCSKFYKCSEGVPVAIDCPTNLLYNPDKEYCDWPENVNCVRDYVPNPDPRPDPPTSDIDNNNNNSGGNSDPSQAPAICAAEGSDGVLVAHEDCSKFYKCSEGVPVAIDCPLNLLYNPDKEYCDWPENVNCDRENIPAPETTPAPEDGNVDNNNSTSGGNSDPSQAPAICAAEGSDGILVAHEDCSKFYKCSEGVPVAIDCPTNLLYNPDKEYCDWPENVNCDRGNIAVPVTTPEPIM